jgi:hypothetical protein
MRSLEGELCVSGNLGKSRRADEKSEPGSILIHPVAKERLCQADIFQEVRSVNSSNSVALTFLPTKSIIAWSAIK